MKNHKTNKVIVLGVDGLDPNTLETLMGKGELPNFLNLKDTGTYKRLATINPPQSPVVWSTIATGNNPGHHNIFDFITRKAGSYTPMHSIVEANSLKPLPVHKGTPFWAITSKLNIPTNIIRWPVTFPPEQVKGHMLSGLGTLDTRGSVGIYTLYTTDTLPKAIDTKGDFIQLTFNNNTVRTAILGSGNLKIPMSINISKDRLSATVTIEKKSYTIKEKEYSNWVHLDFKASFTRHTPCICQFYLSSIEPHFRLYQSPLQIDPLRPVLPISYPDKFATELAHNIGSYNTLGIPEDTNALSDGALDDNAFLDTCDRTMTEREKMLWYELGQLKHGLLAFFIGTTDRIQHIYWNTRMSDGIVNNYYKRIDNILGKVIATADKETVILVLSDHGFTSFKKAVHLNSVLVRNGLMALRKPPQSDSDNALFRDVDWPRTKAYAIGFSSIYLNLQGREDKGVVSLGSEAGQTKRNIVEALLRLKDTETDEPPIKQVYTKEELYNGPYTENAPDLIVGFKPPYRASWQTAIGGAPTEIMEDNLKRWCGDHIVDAQYVPGVLFANCKIACQHPKMTDIAPTILECFGIPKPEHMEGDPLLS